MSMKTAKGPFEDETDSNTSTISLHQDDGEVKPTLADPKPNHLSAIDATVKPKKVSISDHVDSLPSAETVDASKQVAGGKSKRNRLRRFDKDTAHKQARNDTLLSLQNRIRMRLLQKDLNQTGGVLQGQQYSLGRQPIVLNAIQNSIMSNQQGRFQQKLSPEQQPLESVFYNNAQFQPNAMSFQQPQQQGYMFMNGPSGQQPYPVFMAVSPTGQQVPVVALAQPFQQQYTFISPQSQTQPIPSLNTGNQVVQSSEVAEASTEPRRLNPMFGGVPMTPLTEFAMASFGSGDSSPTARHKKDNIKLKMDSFDSPDSPTQALNFRF